MSLLAVLGLRYPVKLLPLLLFESAWKVLWLSLVALPKAALGSLDAGTTETVFSCSLVVLILAVIPWRYVWRHFVGDAGTGGTEQPMPPDTERERRSPQGLGPMPDDGQAGWSSTSTSRSSRST
jgi:hypothetical protein